MALDKTFNLRLDERDRERLEIAAADRGVSLATAVRMAIRDAYERITPARKKAAQAWVEKQRRP